MTLKNLPRHVAIIVDGNRRWARKRGLPDLAGHRHVTDHILEPLIFHSIKLGIPYLTFWAFSTENWRRGPRFYKPLFNLLRQGLKRNIKKYDQAGIRLNVIGDLTPLPKDIVRTITDWVEKSKKNKKITVTIALNYGGRDEILRAIQRLITARLSSSADPKKLAQKPTAEEFARCLDTHDLPDPDLIIRTGGAQRLSGFLLWQCEYSELYFTPTLMPDFTLKEFEKALKDFASRQRRFGR